MWTYLGNIFGIAESQISKFFLFLFYVKFQANDYQEDAAAVQRRSSFSIHL